MPVIEGPFLDFARQAFPQHLPSFQHRMAFSPVALVALEVDFVRGAHEAAFLRVVTRLQSFTGGNGLGLIEGLGQKSQMLWLQGPVPGQQFQRVESATRGSNTTGSEHSLN